MQTGLAGRAATLASSRPWLAAPSVVFAVAGALLGAALFFGGGSSDERLFPIGLAAVAAAATAVAAASLGLVARPALARPGVVFFALLGGLALWIGLSILWSIQPDRSWDSFNRALVYLAFAVLGLFVGALVPRGPRAVALGLAAALALVLAWALLGKVVPSLFADGARRARLRSPVGYWNALALLGAMALILALWLAAAARRHALRVAGVVVAYGAVVAMVLTYSRGGLAIAVVAVVLWLIVSSTAFESLAALAIAAPVGLAVSVWALGRPGVADDGQAYATRVHDGRLFGLVFFAGAALAAAVAAFAAKRRVAPRTRRVVTRGVLVVAAASALIALTASVARAGGPRPWLEARIDDFANPTSVHVTEGPERFGTISSNHRWTWWSEAWEAFTDAPLEGKGAGSFVLVNQLLRDDDIDVTQPHSLPLQFLSDVGLVGLLLALGAAAAAAVAAIQTIRRLRGDDRLAALALAVAASAYLLHAAVDIDWDFVAVSAPFFFVLGVLAAGARGSSTDPARPLWALAAVAVGAAAAFSLALPWLAERRQDDAYAALATNPRAAAQAAEDAHALNPFAIEPLLAWGLAEDEAGDERGALERYRDAVRLQPLNPEAWYALGEFELLTLDDPRSAYAHLRRSYELDRFGPAGERPELLERARRAMTRPRR